MTEAEARRFMRDFEWNPTAPLAEQAALAWTWAETVREAGPWGWSQCAALCALQNVYMLTADERIRRIARGAFRYREATWKHRPPRPALLSVRRHDANDKTLGATHD